MISDNKFVQDDLADVERALGGEPIPPSTYVIFETGEAPLRKQINIHLPLFLVGVKEVTYVAAAFPKLEFQPNYLSSLQVVSGENNDTTIVLANMDSVIARDFKNELPLIITKTLIATAAKAAAIYGAKEGLKKSDYAWIADVVGGIWQAAAAQADLRTWTTLPKEFQFCRLATPADRKIELTAPGYPYPTSVTIDDGTVNVLWVKSVNPNSPLVVLQFKLK